MMLNLPGSQFGFSPLNSMAGLQPPRVTDTLNVANSMARASQQRMRQQNAETKKLQHQNGRRRLLDDDRGLVFIELIN